MKEITMSELMKNAVSSQNKGKRWHFHMLTPDCTFNERKDKHAFVFESENDSESYVVYSDKRHVKEGEQLLKVLHGDKILDRQQVSGKSSNPNIQKILNEAREMNKQNMLWHHHNLFPNCMFNKHKGKWCIIFEDKKSGDILETVYDEEPIQDIREIEVLYYQEEQ